MNRIDGLLRQRGAQASKDGGAFDAQSVLQNEFDDAKTKNAIQKERVRKLNMIHRELSSRPTTGHGGGKPGAKPPTNKYAHVQGKLDQTHHKVSS